MNALLLSMVGLIMCRITPALILVIIGIAFGCIFGAVVFPLSIPLVFGKKDYRAIMGPCGALVSLGGVRGPVLAGKAYDMMGSYNLFYIVASVITVLVIAVMYRILPDKEHQF